MKDLLIFKADVDEVRFLSKWGRPRNNTSKYRLYPFLLVSWHLQTQALSSLEAGAGFLPSRKTVALQRDVEVRVD